ncbi:MAG: hypothetical protein NZZ41_02385 [Candidatus Dojkabacteria bacterium]|nr:hypothetical protein [Candidatus Dojkabacteria bacterium]
MKEKTTNKIIILLSILSIFFFLIGFISGGSLFSLNQSRSNDTSVSFSSNVSLMSSPSLSKLLSVTPKVKVDSVGLYRRNNIVLRVSKSNNIDSRVYYFGSILEQDDKIVMGDWNGDGVSTPGIYRNGNFYFVESYPADNIISEEDVSTMIFGNPNTYYVPIAGDWDGDTKDSLGLYKPDTGEFFLTDIIASDRIVDQATYIVVIGSGAINKIPISGDWDGDGRDSIGYYDSSNGKVYLKNDVTSGLADMYYDVTTYGNVVLDKNNIKIISGDWSNQGFDVPGVYDITTSTFFLRYNHGFSLINYFFTYGDPRIDQYSVPIAGTWVKVIDPINLY